MTTTISHRDYLAAHCPDSEIAARMPRTVGETRAELSRRGRIPVKRERAAPLDEAYAAKDVHWLRAKIRYEYADDMLSCR